MARVIALLGEARAVSLEVRRDGDALIIRGRKDQGSLARDLLAHKALVLAALEQEDECRGHEGSQHDGAHLDWRLREDGRLVCSACQPERIPADPNGVMRAVIAAENETAPAAAETPAPRACPTCGSTGRCEGRLSTADGGWVCRDAVAIGLFRVNWQRS